MRDEFSSKTQQLLAKRVSYRCSLCGAATSGPTVDPNRAANVGEAAHITAASPGGPRFDSSISSEERQSADNGIWLCGTCARKIDVDPNFYTIDVLRSRKKQAEELAGSTLGVATPPPKSQSPLKFRSANEPRFAEIEQHYKNERYTTYLVPVDLVETKLSEGYELGLDPASGREAWVVFQGIPKEEHVLVVFPPLREERLEAPNPAARADS